MKDVIFFDVDTQYDFMRKDGKLYVPDAENIIPNLKKITNFAKRNKVSVIASGDAHKINGLKTKAFLQYCIIGTNGHKKILETRLSNTKVIQNKKLNDKQLNNLLEKYERFWILKQKDDVFSNPNTKKILKSVKKAYVYGVATDYCVKAAVLGLREMDIETYVIKDAIKPVHTKNEKMELDLFRKKGAKFLTTSQLLNRNAL